MRKWLLLVLIAGFSYPAFAQLAFKDTKKENRDKLYRNIIRNSINGNLSKPLTDSTEENWQDAFWAMLVINYKSPWINNKIQFAFQNIEERSTRFKQSLLEMAYNLYPDKFTEVLEQVAKTDTVPLIFAMAEASLFQQPENNREQIKDLLTEKLKQYPDNILLQQVGSWFIHPPDFPDKKQWELLLSKHFLPGNQLLISIQRHNRNQPGLMIFRKADGGFLTDSNGIVVHYPQLARSLTNLPWFFKNGNTPQGIYRMAGFSVSGSSFIGPTPNLQMRMPFEIWPSEFLKSPNPDSIWLIEKYKQVIPEALRLFPNLYQSFYAGLLGRTEIIAHGTTVDPTYYQFMPFYPLTPTQGCLTAKEIWDENTGIIIETDQRKMVDALLASGGAAGYVLVIEIDDQQRPVQLSEILPLIDEAAKYAY